MLLTNNIMQLDKTDFYWNGILSGAVNNLYYDFINVDVDAVANVRISTKPELIRVAAKHFLNQDTDEISNNVQQILEGNMREIIGQMQLVDLVNNKQLFSQKIQENAHGGCRFYGIPHRQKFKNYCAASMPSMIRSK